MRIRGGHKLNFFLVRFFKLSAAFQFEYGGTAVDARIYLRDFFDLLSGHFDLYRLWRFGMIHEPRWHEMIELAAYQNWVCIQRQS